MPIVPHDSFASALAATWHPAYGKALLLVAILLLLLQRARPVVPHLLRNTLVFLGLAARGGPRGHPLTGMPSRIPFPPRGPFRRDDRFLEFHA